METVTATTVAYAIVRALFALAVVAFLAQYLARHESGPAPTGTVDATPRT